MQYSVPQFLEVEDTVVGPLTISQSLYLGAAAVVGFISILIFAPLLALAITLIATIICVAFAFYRPNGRTLAIFLTNFFVFGAKPKLYVWKREPEGFVVKRAIKKETPNDLLSAELKIVSRNRLQELAWTLDTREVVDAEGEGERE